QRVQSRVAVAGDHERGVAALAVPDQMKQGLHYAVHMLLSLDARRAFLQRDAVDRRAARDAQRRASLVDAARHGRARVRVDDEEPDHHCWAIWRCSKRESSRTSGYRQTREVITATQIAVAC